MALHTQRLAASRNSAMAPEVVLIHGWGMSSAIWARWLPLLRPHCNITLLDLPGYGASDEVPGIEVDALLALCLRVLPERAVYIGYSLGGMLAARIATRFPKRVSALLTLASNARFVADGDWPWAMPEATFTRFSESLDNPAAALKRFSGLQLLGCSEEKSLLKTLRDMQEPVSTQVLANSLQWLRAIDLRDELSHMGVPARYCFAEHDALVPAVAAQHFPAGWTEVIAGAAHAMFLSHPERCADIVLDFLHEQQLLVEVPGSTPAGRRRKLDVARSFSRAARSYDQVAELQRQVGSALLDMISNSFSSSRQAIVDLGCGTGYFFPALKQRMPRAQIVGVDLAEGMVAHARRARKGGLWVCGDAENLPLAEQSVALIFSSLTIQWCEDVEALFAEIYRVLSPGGQLVFSTLGPDTLHELREAWQQVDNYTHVNSFQPWQTLREGMTAAGFQPPPLPATERVTLEYNTLGELTAELKKLGAHNLNRGRPQGLTGKQRMMKFVDAYEQLRNDRGYLPASYEVWYGVLTKPGI